ncbi:zinc finger protein Xfin-like [Montipora foliosa]|uniref:zinc finger protein Xfin-like n=1 Tax=Montipora foliosa TaxID=591990 RepID=UPI0035F12440
MALVVSQEPEETFELKLEMDSDEDKIIDIETCEGTIDSAIEGAFQDELKLPVFLEGKLDSHTEGALPDKLTPPVSLKDAMDIPTVGALQHELTPPNSLKDYEELLDFPKAWDALPGHEPKLKEFTIPLNKLRVSRNCRNKKLELEEDEYILCSKCNKLQIGACSIHCNLRWVKEPLEVLVTEGQTKARATIPKNMDLKSSSIPDAGLGIFAKERFESDVVFGPYWGQKITVADVTSSMDQSYMWDIIENGLVTHVIDARDEKYSNWLRFVNCARNEDEQNLVAFQYRGEIYYRSYKVIEPGMELLVWYGDRYACDLDILDKENKPSGGPIQCQKCFMICSGPISLASHNKFRCQMNSEHNRWRCMHCDRSFKSQSSLHFHKNIHKGLRPFICNICGKAFTRPSSRNRHYLSFHVDKESFDCKICNKAFSNENHLKTHMKKSHKWQRQTGYHSSSIRYQCKQCLKCFSSSKNLNRHTKLHAKSDDGTKLCENEIPLRRNEATHNQTSNAFDCQHCGQGFMSSVSLSNHMRMHEKQTRLNVCSICKLSFDYSGNLSRHMREKHPRVKVIKCGKCNKVCADKRILAIHVAIRHPVKRSFVKDHLGFRQGKMKKPFPMLTFVKCNTCKLAMPKNKLPDHMLTHHKTITNSKNKSMTASDTSGKFRCEICLAVFRTSKLMHCHRASHFKKRITTPPGVTTTESTVPSRQSDDSVKLDNKELRCDACDETFSSLDKLRSHSSVHLRNWNLSKASNVQQQPSFRNKESTNLNWSPTTIFCCQVCKKTFQTETSLRSHKSHHSRSHTSSEAKSKLLSQKEQQKLHEHQQNYVNTELTKTQPASRFCCHVCQKSFRTERSLRSHKSHHSRLHSSSSSPPQPLLKSSQESNKCHLKKDSKDASIGKFGYNNSRTNADNGHYGQTLGKPSGNSSYESAKTASKRELFACEKCGKKFLSKLNLIRHKAHHARSNPPTQFTKTHSNSKITVNGNSQKLYECSTCLESFQEKRSLVSHQRRSHIGIKANFICPFCDRTFSTKASLYLHKQDLHNSSDPFTCRRCNGQFSSKYSRNNHACCAEERAHPASHKKRRHVEDSSSHREAVRKVRRSDTVSSKKRKVEGTLVEESKKAKRGGVGSSADKHYLCNVCLEFFPTRIGLSNHKRSHSGHSDPFVCFTCHRGFASKRNLLRHRDSQHNATTSTRVSTDSKLVSKRNQGSCGVNLTWNRGTYSLVQKTSSSPKNNVSKFSCLTCNKQFGTYNGYYKHKRRRHAKENHVSSGRAHTSITMNDHQTISSRSLFKCQYCEKQLQTRSTLRRHVREKHGKRVNLQSEQMRLLDVKSTNTRWKCQHCEKGFKTEFGLNRHVEKRHDKRIWVDRHDDGKTSGNNSSSWKCTYCSKEFNSIHGIRKHVLRKHPGRKRIYSRKSDQPEVTVKSRIGFENSEKGKGKHAVRAFECQYCHKGFLTINRRYKHILLAHRGDLVSLPLALKITSDSKSENLQNTIHPKCLEGRDNREAGVNEINNSKLHDEETKTKLLQLPIKARRKGGSLKSNFCCRYCRKRLSSRSSCRRHELRLHEKLVGSSFALHNDQNRKTEKENACDKTVVSMKEKSGVFENRNVEPPARPSLKGCVIGSLFSLGLPPGIMAFPCQHCPRRFITINRRYKHTLLAHSVKVNTSFRALEGDVQSGGEKSDRKSVKAKSCRSGYRDASLYPFKQTLPASELGQVFLKRSKPQQVEQHDESSPGNDCEVALSISPSHLITTSVKDKSDAKSVKTVLPCFEGKNDVAVPPVKVTPLPSKSLGHFSRKTSILHQQESLDGLVNKVNQPVFDDPSEVTLSLSTSQMDTETGILQIPNAKVVETVVSDEENNGISVPCAKRAFPATKSTVKRLRKGSRIQLLNPPDGLINTNGKISALFAAGKPLRKAKAFPCAFCEKSFSCNALRYKHFLFIHSRSGGLAEKELVTLENTSVNKSSRASSHKAIGIVPFNFNETVGSGGNNSGTRPSRSRNGLVRGKHGIGKAVCRICHPNTFGTVLQGKNSKDVRSRPFES